jgi:hypothetical protein
MGKVVVIVEHVALVSGSHCARGCPWWTVRASGRDGCNLFRCTRNEARALNRDSVGAVRHAACLAAERRAKGETK